MCRLYGFRASAPTKLDCSLVRAQNALMLQSRRDHRGVANADGWGIGFYEDGAPHLEKCDTPAFEDRHFREVADRVTAATVVAHVRKATVGARGSSNTHPFSYGVWMFAHNGTLTAFERVAEPLEREIGETLLGSRRGTTDSELIFLWILSRMAGMGLPVGEVSADVTRLADVLRECVALLAERCEQAGASEPARLNFMLTDGSTLFASRWGNTLYGLTREEVRDCRICGMSHVEEALAEGYRAAAIASEPITGEDWKEVPEQSLVIVESSLQVRVGPIG